MTDTIEVKNAIQILLKYSDCVAWLDFGDRGNSCYSPFNFDTEKELIEEAYAFAAVKIAMPKGTELNQKLMGKISRKLGCKYITYDWLIKAISRIVGNASYKELENMIHLSAAVKSGMKKRGLTTIIDVEEAFS